MMRFSLALEGMVFPSWTGVWARGVLDPIGLVSPLSKVATALLSPSTIPRRQQAWNSWMITLLPFTFPWSKGSSCPKTGEA